MNTTLIECKIDKYKDLEKYHKKEGYKDLSKFYKGIKEEFQDCLNVVTGRVHGYMKAKN